MLKDCFGMQLKCWKGGGREGENSWHGSYTSKEPKRGMRRIWRLSMTVSQMLKVGKVK